ncbi:MAG: SIS domain-containing protein, partial [Desulfobacterales bacterium]
MNCLIEIFSVIRQMFGLFSVCLSADVYFGRHIAGLPDGSMVFFPCRDNLLCCGLTGIVAFKQKNKADQTIDIESLKNMLIKIKELCYANCRQNDLNIEDHYLGGQTQIEAFLQNVRNLKCNDLFYNLFIHLKHQDELSRFADRLFRFIDEEEKLLDNYMGSLQSNDVDILSRRIDCIKDAGWCLTSEIISNIKKVKDLLRNGHEIPSSYELNIFKQINAVLNSIDRLEVRGRDSAGLSMMFVLDGSEFDRFEEKIKKENLYDQLKERSSRDVLVNLGIKVNESGDENGQKRVAIALTYKVAAEVGSLGDNIQSLRNHIKNDTILHKLVSFHTKYHTISAHTRWASVGAISEPNCHPVDNSTSGISTPKSGIIHACLNGDIDNYMELKNEYEQRGGVIPPDITTDTKIIPLQIEKYINQGVEVQEAFRLAVNDFKGSHAISMHTDLAPGKIFLAQKGSGQAIFIGMAKDYYMPTSEVYGLIEETPFFIKMDGEKEAQGRDGITQGQIFILNQDSAGGMDGITATYYDNTPIDLGENDIKHTEITSRDIDRQDFPHYFLKEISESPHSVEKTLQNRWKIKEDKIRRYVVTLDEKTFPGTLQKALLDKKIRRIFFVGQGTAGVAAHACADILNYYMNNPLFYISAIKASELSGFKLNDDDDKKMMSDSLVIAISQSGTTTDTNRTIDMVKERGAYTMAIVNRRDSDITFKVDGVMYTSSGRDIEMSVASTKAFYSQIVAGALLALKIARLQGRRSDSFVEAQIKELLEMPGHMRKILSMHNKIGNSAKRLATTKTYWAAVGSGPNKTSADEIRIKLSELCYKTISSDYVEDKKHIDLSSEPLILVCAAGARGTVIGDIIKDTAIFQAHKATVVVIANEGENRFEPYAADVFHVPIVSEHFAPILNTLVGHIWGYYAAMAINEG